MKMENRTPPLDIRGAGMEALSHDYDVAVPANRSLNLRGRMPSTAHEDANTMPVGMQMLSPKTPMMHPSFTELFQQGIDPNAPSVQTALNALDSYANSASAVDLMPNVQRQISESENNFDWNLNETKCLIDPNLINQSDDSVGYGGMHLAQNQQPIVGPQHVMAFHEYTPTSGLHSAEHADTIGPLQEIAHNNTNMEETTQSVTEGENNNRKAQILIKRGNRQKTLSLNPDEREALETLIEDVIIEGVDMSDSDDSEEGSDEKESKSDKDSTQTSTGDEKEDGGTAKGDENKTVKSAGKDSKAVDGKPGKPGETKVYPAQLKVAVKHMKNLPPRFLRKLQVAGKDGDTDKKENKVKLSPEAKSPEKESEELEVIDAAGMANQARVELKGKAREDAKIEAKKQIRDLLVGYDQHGFLDDSPSTENAEPLKQLDVSMSQQTEQLSPHNVRVDTLQNEMQNLQALREALPETVTITSSLSPDHNIVITNPDLPQSGHNISPGSMYDPSQQNMSNVHRIPQPNRIPLPPMLLTSNAVNCDDLERELLKGSDQLTNNAYSSGYTPPPNIQRMPNSSAERVDHAFQELITMSGGPEKKTMQFSVDAPEFVPSSTYAPIGMGQQMAGPIEYEYERSPLPGMPPPPATSPFQSMVGRVSPQVALPASTMSPVIQQLGTEQLVASMGRNSPVTGSPCFMIPKIPTSAPPSHPTVPPPPGVMSGYPYPVHGAYTTAFQPQYTMPAPYLSQSGMAPWPADTNHHQQKPINPSYAYSQNQLGNNSPKLRDRQIHQMMNSRPNSAPNATSPHLARHTPVMNPPPTMPPNHSTTNQAPQMQTLPVNHNQMYPVNLGRSLSPNVANQLVGSLLQEGKLVMVILRGCPGSGKSTLAKEMQYENGVTLNTDEYFLQNGEYLFDKNRLGEAHEWNQKRALDSVLSGKNPIVIDNTNIQAWEMKYYYALARKHCYHVEIIEPETPWKNNPQELAQRNQHGVSKEVIKKMIDRYDHHITLQKIMGASLKKDPKDPVKEDQDQKTTFKKKRRKRRRRSRKGRDKNKENDSSQQDDDASTDEETTPTRNNVIEEEKSPFSIFSPADKENIKPLNIKPLTFTAHNLLSTTGEESDECSDSDGESSSLVSRESSIDISKTCCHLSSEPRSLCALAQQALDSLQTDTKCNILSDANTHTDDLHSFVKTLVRKIIMDSVSIVHGGAYIIANGYVSSDNNNENRYSINKVTHDDTDVTTTTDNDKLQESSTNSGNVPTPEVESSYWSSPAHTPDLYSINNDNFPSSSSTTTTEEDVKSPTYGAQGSMLMYGDNVWGSPKPKRSQRWPKWEKNAQHPQTDIWSIEKNLSKSVQDVKVESNSVFILQPDELTTVVDVTIQPENQPSPERYTPSADAAMQHKTINSPVHGRHTPTIDPPMYSPDAVRHKVMHSPVSGRYTPTMDPTAYSPSADAQSAIQHQIMHSTVPGRNTPTIDQTLYSPNSDAAYRHQMMHSPVSGRYTPTMELAAYSPSTDATVRHQMMHSPVPGRHTPTMDRASYSPSSDTALRHQIMNSPVPGRHTPTIDPAVRQELMSAPAWKVPPHSTSSVTYPFIKVTTTRLSFSNVETYTDPQDFAAIQRMLKQGDEQPAENSMRFLQVLQPNNTAWARQTVCAEVAAMVEASGSGPASPSRSQNTSLDKSCSTEDLLCQHTEGVDFLVNCFPGVARDDLSDIVDRCQGDVQWAVNILLDSGCEYADTYGLQNAQPDADVTPTSESSADVKSRNQSGFQPVVPSLFELAYASLPVSHSTIDSGVQEEIASRSLSRMHSIEEFCSKHTDLNSDEGEIQPVSLEENNLSSLEEFQDYGSNSASSVSTSKEGSVRKKIKDKVVTLNLPRDVAGQLLAMFGPIGPHSSPEFLTDDELSVPLSQKIARFIYQSWNSELKNQEALAEEAKQKRLRQDANMAKRLQKEEEEKAKIPQRTVVTEPAKMEPAVNSYPATPWSKTSTTAPSLKEIMEEEKVIELSKKEYENENQKEVEELKFNAETIATCLKRQKLRKLFHKIDPQMLEQIFQANSFSLELTIKTIRVTLGPDSVPKNVMTDEAIALCEEQLVKQAMDESRALYEKREIKESQISREASPVKQPLRPAHNFRNDGVMHYHLRQECFQKAQEAYRRGAKPVASFYAQQGHLHTHKLQEVNKRLAEDIARQNRSGSIESQNSLDLHGLYVKEAVEILQATLVTRELEQRDRPDKRRMHLLVVTGRGTHSSGGTSKIRPAVLGFLRKNNYRFTEPTQGEVKVLLKYRDRSEHMYNI